MKPIVKALYNEPAVILGIITVAAPILVGAGVVAGWIGALAAAAATVLTRQLVKPKRRR